ncbi:hypothetical protein GGI42DRAFT_326064 [Trichoderma sp. SZMC 28013]
MLLYNFGILLFYFFFLFLSVFLTLSGSGRPCPSVRGRGFGAWGNVGLFRRRGEKRESCRGELSHPSGWRDGWRSFNQGKVED